MADTEEVQADRILERYVQIAEVLGRMFSPILEVIVHDLRRPNESIIAIHNGHITGRAVGGPATDLGKRLMEDDLPDVLINYKNESPRGHHMKSSSVAIRDDNGALIGVLGLNLDIAYFEQFGRFIEKIISIEEYDFVTETEHFDTMHLSPSKDIRNAIEQYKLARNLNARTITGANKREIVEHLYRKAYFNNRGAVTTIARELDLSRPSVYNYVRAYRNRIANMQCERTTDQS